MDSASIGSALHDLILYLNELYRYDPFPTRLKIELKKLQIFVLISTRNLDNQQLDDSNPPWSFVLRIVDTIDQYVDPDPSESAGYHLLFKRFERGIESLVDEIDQWYFSMRDSLLLQFRASLFTIDDISEIFTSILELLEENYCVRGSKALIELVKVWQTLICFVHYPIPQLLALAANVAIHVHLHFMCPRAVQRPGEESLDKLLSTFKPNDPLVSETYIQALISSKLSRGSLAALSTNQHNIYDGTKNFLDFLVDHLWEWLRLNTTDGTVSVKDQMQELFHKLRSLRATLKQKQPNNIKADVASVLCDAGVLIFSLSQTDKKVDLVCFHDLLKTFKAILLQLGEKDPPVPDFNFPKTNQLGYVDFVLEKLADLTSREAKPIPNNNYVQTVHEELVSLRSFLGDIAEFYQEHEEFQVLWNRVLEVTCKVECLIDQLLVVDLWDCSSTSVDAILEDIRDIKAKSEVKKQEIGGKRQQKKVREATRTHDQLPSQTTTKYEVVGFVDDAKRIMDRLKRGSKELKVISIVGMPGLGKTTLASKVYNDDSFSLHFHVHAWCPVSQALDKKNVLSKLLKQVDPNCVYSETNEQDLVEKLWRKLKGKRYLILLDDIWDAEAWNSLAPAFPDDNYGSRILLTSRHRDIAPVHMIDQDPYFLHPLNEKESLELFQLKLFSGNLGLDPALHDLVSKFAAQCKGLPLSIILIAGILATTNPEDWSKIWEDFNSGNASVTEQCMDSLELSYKCLPDHLKPCLLYFGVFPEDAEIPTKKLLYIWIAEGFIRETDGKRIKDVAEDYLNVLIGRSLIMVSQKRWNGGVRTCRIHDLLRDYCLQKSKGDHFFHVIKGYDEISAFNEPCNLRRLCIQLDEWNHFEPKLFCPRARSLLFQVPRGLYYPSGDASFVISICKLLRVLDLEKIKLSCEFPCEISSLVQLAFLALRGKFRHIPSSISKLSNLETLIVDPSGYVMPLPNSFWNLQNLKYVYIRRGGLRIVPMENLDNSPVLYELDVFCGACIPYECSLERLMTKFPNIRMLKCKIGFGEDERLEYPHTAIVVPDFSTQLESVDLSWVAGEPKLPKGLDISFPENLKRLRLENFYLSWENMSTIGKLPNLQVFKLCCPRFEGDTWEMEPGEFSQLRVLDLYRVKLVRWISEDDQFDCLQKLLLEDCEYLREMPCNCLESISTLEKIEVVHCSETTEKLAKQIEDQQVNEWGNSNLKINIVTKD